jgi:uncharacterized protein YpuA (DUF1002 family)
MFGTRARQKSPQAKRSPREKEKSIIREYEKRYGVQLTDEEIDALIFEVFSNSDMSDDTKEEVQNRLKSRSGESEEEEQEEE